MGQMDTNTGSVRSHAVVTPGLASRLVKKVINKFQHDIGHVKDVGCPLGSLLNFKAKGSRLVALPVDGLGRQTHPIYPPSKLAFEYMRLLFLLSNERYRST